MGQIKLAQLNFWLPGVTGRPLVLNTEYMHAHSLIIPPPRTTKLLGGILVSLRPSVRLSVRPSVRPSVPPAVSAM